MHLRRFAVALACLGLVASAPATVRAQAPRYVALVIGNSSYQYWNTLRNPTNDATLIAQSLQKLGFTLVDGKPLLNLDRAGFVHALQNFGSQSAGADVALFYYSGHGLQVAGVNYLVPTEANPANPADLDLQMVAAMTALKEMEGGNVRLKVMILDACRDNPYARKVGATTKGSALEGLARMSAPDGSIISFATQPDNAAQDGAGDYSPFAAALAATLPQRGLDIFQMFNRVGVQVETATKELQRPFVDYSPLRGDDFYFGGRADTTPGSDPAGAALHYKKANDLFGAGNMIDAALEYSMAATLDPSYADAHYGLGIVYKQQNNLNGAEAEYLKAIKLDAKDAYPHNGLGNVYLIQSKLDAAAAEYRTAISLNPTFEDPHYNLGVAYRRQNNLTGAVTEYRKAIGLDPTDTYPHNGLGIIYIGQNNLDAAATEFRRAIQLNATFEDPHYNLGTIYKRQHNLDAAAAEFRTAITLDPRDDFPHNGLGDVFYDQKKFDAAESEYRTAIGLNPKSPLAHRNLAILYRAQGKSAEAAAEDRLADAI